MLRARKKKNKKSEQNFLCATTVSLEGIVQVHGQYRRVTVWSSQCQKENSGKNCIFFFYITFFFFNFNHSRTRRLRELSRKTRLEPEKLKQHQLHRIPQSDHILYVHNIYFFFTVSVTLNAICNSFSHSFSFLRASHVAFQEKSMLAAKRNIWCCWFVCLKCENIVKIECPQKLGAQRPLLYYEEEKKEIYIKLFQTCCASSCLNSNKLDTTRSLTFFSLSLVRCALSIDNGKIQNCLYYYISGQKYVHVSVCAENVRSITTFDSSVHWPEESITVHAFSPRALDKWYDLLFFSLYTSLPL